MRLPLAVLLGTGLCWGSAGSLACGERDETRTAVAEPRPQGEVARGFRRQPRPGERVPQPELDGYCAAPERSVAYYYHGGSPVVRVARKDGCAPLYITDCELEGRCYAPRDQEPGMWCCSAEEAGEAATAKR